MYYIVAHVFTYHFILILKLPIKLLFCSDHYSIITFIVMMSTSPPNASVIDDDDEEEDEEKERQRIENELNSEAFQNVGTLRRSSKEHALSMDEGNRFDPTDDYHDQDDDDNQEYINLYF